MPLNEIVEVTINRETTAVSRTGFGTPLVLGHNLNSANRIEYYSDLSSAAGALIGGNDSVDYNAVNAIFSQSPRPSRVAIGQRRTNRIITDDAGTYTAGNIVMTVNGTEIDESYDTDKDTTLGNLATSIQGLSDVSTAVYSAISHTITITPASEKVLSVSVDLSGITGTMTMELSSASPSEDVDDALDAIKLVDNDWYGLMITSRTQSEQEDAAAWALSNKKLSVFADDNSDIINTTDTSDTTSLPAKLKAASNDRAAVIYHQKADGSTNDEYPDGALLGRILPLDPGSYTAKFKKLSGVTVSNLTTTQSGNALDKNCNTYQEIAGVDIFREGTTTEGEFIDIMHFIDWLEARTQENVYSPLVNELKVPYTTAGIAAVDGQVRQVLQTGQNRGGISPTEFNDDDVQIGGFYTEVPALADISSSDKANRLLQDVKFTAFLSGAIHKVKIVGTVTL